jgi:hypothetical protein
MRSNQMRRAVILLLFPVALVLAGCATPERYTNEPLSRYDRDTTYRVDEASDGFIVTVKYSRYQFIPESDAVSAAGRSALLSIAHEQADKRGRKVEVNEQRIRMSMGRNGVSGVTSWSGALKVLYR